MMEKLLTLKDGSNIIIVEKVKYSGKLYVLAVYVDTNTSQILNTMSIFELKIKENNEIVVAPIDTPEIKEEVAKLLYKKLEENANI